MGGDIQLPAGQEMPWGNVKGEIFWGFPGERLGCNCLQECQGYFHGRKVWEDFIGEYHRRLSE